MAFERNDAWATQPLADQERPDCLVERDAREVLLT